MPGTAVAPCFKVNVVVVIVEGSIASLNVAPTLMLIGTPVALLAGMVALTLGGVVSRTAAVAKVQVKLLPSGISVVSVAPVVTVAVHVAPAGRLAVGEKIAIRLAAT